MNSFIHIGIRRSHARNVRSAFVRIQRNSKRGMSKFCRPPSQLILPRSDEYCPHCDNHFVLDAKTPKPVLNIDGEDARIDSRMLKDDRIQVEEQRTICNVKDAADRLG